MKDKEYGVPSQKKFPLDTKEHVLSAIRFFNYVDPAYEKELASAIISKIKEYDISNLTPSAANRFYKYYKPDYVEHHGIIGMRWGRKNGPPYPLTGRTHTAVTRKASSSEIAAAKKRGNGEVESLHTSNSRKKKLSAGQKAAIGIGVAAAAAGTAYGIYRITHRGSSKYLPSTKVLTGNDRVKAMRMGELNNIRTMKDKDLANKIARLKREKEYRNLILEDAQPKKAKAKKEAKDIIIQAGKKIVVAGGAGAAAYAVKAMLQGSFDKKEFAQYVAANPNKKK